MNRHGRLRGRRMSKDEFSFLINTDLLLAAREDAKSQLIAQMNPVELKAGERLISQGEQGDRFYLIQNGSCRVTLEKDDQIHLISRLKSGDLVGEMAILTGEIRTANVDAETDMVVWSIGRSQFDELCGVYRELREFLTQIVTRRLSSTKLTADRIIGKYTIREFLGQGGWSLVYKGAHSALNLPVAIKMLKHDMAMDPDFSEKFQNEAKVVAGLNHENIVRVYDIEHLFRTVFIMMEYLEGAALDQILENLGRLPFNRVLDLLTQICHGLNYAHSKGVVHQDIKPANIFVQEDDRAKILDFGLACPTGSEDLIGLPGTPYYMSPEQIEGDPVDERTDIYSLGITAFEIATGQRPFPQKDVKSLLQAHREEPVPDPRILNPDLPAEFAEFVDRATRKDPERRFQDAGEALDKLISLSIKTGLRGRSAAPQKRKMMNLFMFYRDEQQLELSRVVEAFARELELLGTDFRVTNFEEV
jgi:eukaryotic-like serine/threonine-protein kinase